MKSSFFAFVLIMLLLLSGCSDEVTNPISLKPEDRPIDVEPTATYDWMAGECPFSNARVGRVRQGLTMVPQAISPNGVYFIENANADPSFIVYADHGSDTFVKLCGRVDCTHSGSDCNAYLCKGSSLTYYRGYLYAVAGGTVINPERGELIRMEPDGSDHVTVLDLNAFAKENGAEFSVASRFFEGNLMFFLYVWETTGNPDGSELITPKMTESYRYKLDGSMNEPVKRNVFPSYYSGDMLYCVGPPRDDEHRYSILTCDIEADTETFLLDHPGFSALYMQTGAYYHKDGAIRHLEYSTMEETVVVETGLQGSYDLSAFPDCIVIAQDDAGEERDPNLYIYNWAFELVDTVTINFPYMGYTQFTLISETPQMLILTATVSDSAMPKYYIDKAELGTGDVQIHEFKYA